jgi:hypothetical protein
MRSVQSTDPAPFPGRKIDPAPFPIYPELDGDIDVRGLFGLDENVRKGCHQVRVKSPASATELKQLAQYSAVYEMVSGSLPVAFQLETCRTWPPRSARRQHGRRAARAGHVTEIRNSGEGLLIGTHRPVHRI